MYRTIHQIDFVKTYLQLWYVRSIQYDDRAQNIIHAKCTKSLHRYTTIDVFKYNLFCS